MKSLYALKEWLSAPIRQYLRWKRLEAIAAVAQAAKDPDSGHRVYLRCITILELELGIHNEDNYEVKEGFLKSVDELKKINDETPSEAEEETDVLFQEDNS